MDKKPLLGSDPLEWIRWYVSEDNLKEFFNTPEKEWGKTYSGNVEQG